MNRKTEIKGTLLFLFAGVAFTIGAYLIPTPMLQQDLNTTPASFPIMLGIMFIIVSLGLLIKIFFSRPALVDSSMVNGAEWFTTNKSAIVVMGILLIYLIIMQIIGWMVSSFLMIVSVFKIVGKGKESQNKLPLILFLGFVITAMVFIIFDLLLGVPLPRGLFSLELLIGL